MKHDPHQAPMLTKASVVRVVLSAAMFVPLGIIGSGITCEFLGLPNPPDPVLLLGVVMGSICGVAFGFATQRRRKLNAMMALMGIAGSIGFGVTAMHIANSAPTGLAALPSAISVAIYGVAAVTSLIAFAVGSIGLISQRCT